MKLRTANIHTVLTGGKYQSLEALSLTLTAFSSSDVSDKLNCMSKLLSHMLNERSTNNNSRCQHAQHVHCSSYSVMLIAFSPILFAHKLTPAKRHVPDTDSVRSYWPSLWRSWNKFVTTWPTVHYTRYTRIIHCRPCCNVHVVRTLSCW